jgi:hypothetical protein
MITSEQFKNFDPNIVLEQYKKLIATNNFNQEKLKSTNGLILKSKVIENITTKRKINKEIN